MAKYTLKFEMVYSSGGLNHGLVCDLIRGNIYLENGVR